MAPRVLLVGEIGTRLEVDFIGAGLACTVAPTAAAGVGWMRQSPFPVVVVPPTLPDMQGNVFARGLLQHFPDAIVLMYGGIIDEHLEPFVKDGRVVPVPEQTSISSVADYLRRRLASKSSSPSMSPSVSPSPSPSPVAVDTGLPPGVTPLGPAPASNVAPSTTLSPKPGLPRAKTSAPVPVVMLQADDDAEEQAKQAAQQIVDLQARIGAAEWALGKEKQARADVDRALFETKEQLKAAQQALQEAAQQGSAQGAAGAANAAAKAATEAIVRERDELQAARDNAQRERDAIAAGRDAIAQERDTFAAERDELKVQATSLQMALDDAREAARALEAERDDLGKRLGAVSGQVSMMQAQLDDERIAHGQARAELDKARADVEKLRQDLAEFHRETRNAIDAKTRAAAEAASARADLGDARAQMDALSAQLDGERRGRAADAEAHKAALAALDVKVANHAEALRRVAADLKTQMDESKVAKAESDAARTRIKELEEALAAAKASAQAALEGNKLTDHDKRKLEARTTEMAREVEEAKRKAEEAREEMFKARQLRDDAELHSADLEIQIVDLKEALEKQRADLTTTLESTRAELAAAQQKISELSASVDELRTSGGRNNAELQLLEGRLDAVTRERDRALSALTDASRKLMELEDERQAAS